MGKMLSGTRNALALADGDPLACRALIDRASQARHKASDLRDDYVLAILARKRQLQVTRASQPYLPRTGDVGHMHPKVQGSKRWIQFEIGFQLNSIFRGLVLHQTILGRKLFTNQKHPHISALCQPLMSSCADFQHKPTVFQNHSCPDLWDRPRITSPRLMGNVHHSTNIRYFTQ